MGYIAKHWTRKAWASLEIYAYMNIVQFHFISQATDDANDSLGISMEEVTAEGISFCAYWPTFGQQIPLLQKNIQHTMLIRFETL